jgi:hypothetical protein
MGKYSKFIVAAAGLGALLALRHFDVSLPGFDAVVLETIVSALTAAGVYQVRNS